MDLITGNSPPTGLPPSPKDEGGASTTPLLHLYSLPDLAHDVIASFLSNKDMLQMMETSLWLLEAYGGRVKELLLRENKHGNGTTITSMLSRRVELQRITIKEVITFRGLLEAMRLGHLERLQALDIQRYFNRWDPHPNVLHVLVQVLEGGACPRLKSLTLVFDEHKDTKTLVALGDAMRSRMARGCCGLKALAIKPFGEYEANFLPDMSPMLSSGACEALEELRLDGYELGKEANEGVVEWLSRTKASHLRVFTIGFITLSVAAALSLEGVGPRLQSVEVLFTDRPSFVHLTGAIERRAWPDLRQLKVNFDRNSVDIIPRLMEGLIKGAPELRVLATGGWVGIGQAVVVAVARGLRDGACPRLEELDIKRAHIMDVGTIELARALEGGAPCSKTLQRLRLRSCKIYPEGMRELAGALARGACPKLEYLDLSDNHELKDEGAIHVAQAMLEGALPHLRELNLESNRMGERGASALSQALRCPTVSRKLERLKIGCGDLKADVVRGLMQSIEASRGPGHQVELS